MGLARHVLLMFRDSAGDGRLGAAASREIIAPAFGYRGPMLDRVAVSFHIFATSPVNAWYHVNAIKAALMTGRRSFSAHPMVNFVMRRDIRFRSEQGIPGCSKSVKPPPHYNDGIADLRSEVSRRTR